ncbi:MAG: basic amino acid/polyamine antiporter, family [Pyrinomonadaceae bacterium]|jgi:APA family basic amino acid/polyamine antiporter|nr:basic amino acid/polyamine antiporter, family [Pyrinomonadaceae bacterium]
MDSANKNQLVRGLSLVAAISIVIGNVIGTGVFLKARVMTCNVGTPKMVLLVYVIAGLLSLAGALTYAELAAMMPRAGGEYVFLREAYGPRWAFLYGWMSFFIGKAGSQAALGVGFAIFLNVLLGGVLSGQYFALNLFGYQFPFGHLQVVALAAIVIVTLINCAAVNVSGGVAAFLTGIKIALVLLVGIGAFLLAQGADWSHFAMSNAGGACEGVSASARAGFAGFGAAMLGALWAYDGWNNVTLVAGEVKDPQRNLPRALIGGMLLVSGLYIFVNFAYFYVLSPTEVANVSAASSVATEVARRFLGPLAISLIAAALLSSTFGTLHTSILTGARVPYAMAQDRLFFRSLSRVSARTHVPIGALIAQAIWACILTLSGSFDALTDYAIFGLWIFYALVTASVFVFRKRMPDAERPYRTWGYPVVPILFLIVAGMLLVNTVLTTPKQALTGVALIALGLPVYWYWARLNQRRDEN